MKLCKIHWQYLFSSAEVKDFGFPQALAQSKLWYCILFSAGNYQNVQTYHVWHKTVVSNQMLLLQRACEDLEKETQEREEDKVRYLEEKLPPLQLSGLSLDELQVRVVFKTAELNAHKFKRSKFYFFFKLFLETLQTATWENRRSGRGAVRLWA